MVGKLQLSKLMMPTISYFDGEPVDIAVGNFLMNSGTVNGFSRGIASSSGSIGDNTSGKYPCVWRGIENPFGNIYQFVDGVNITDNQAWICKDADKYASNLFTDPYEQLSYINSNADGYTKEFGFDHRNPFAEFTTSVVVAHQFIIVTTIIKKQDSVLLGSVGLGPMVLTLDCLTGTCTALLRPRTCPSAGGFLKNPFRGVWGITPS